MYVKEFPVLDSAESRLLGFGFRKALADGEALTGATFTISVIDGTDASAAARLIGPALVVGDQARQRVANLVPGTRYKLQAIVVTNHNNTKSLWGGISCKG